MSFGDNNRRGDDEILRKDGGRGGGHITRKECQVQSTCFFQAASGRGEAESARQGRFGGGLFHGRGVRGANAKLTEETSDPPGDRRLFRRYRRRSRGSWLFLQLCEILLELRDGSTNGFFGSATGDGLGSDGGIERKAVQEIISEVCGNFAEIARRELHPRLVLLFGFAQNLPKKIVSLAKRHTAADEVVGGVSGEESRIGSGGTKAVFAELCLGESTSGHGEHVVDLVVSSEKCFLVFLEITLIAGWQTLQGNEKGEEGAGDASSFAAQEFPGIGVFLLGHEAAARRVFIGRNDIRKLLGGEEDKIFGEARKVGGNAGKSEKIIEGKITVAYGVEAIGRDARKAKIARDGVSINGKGAPRKSTRAHGTDVGGGSGALQARKVSRKSLSVSH